MVNVSVSRHINSRKPRMKRSQENDRTLQSVVGKIKPLMDRLNAILGNRLNPHNVMSHLHPPKSPINLTPIFNGYSPPSSYGAPPYAPPPIDSYGPPPVYEVPDTTPAPTFLPVTFDDAPKLVYGIAFRVRRAYTCGEQGIDCEELERQGKVVECDINRFR